MPIASGIARLHGKVAICYTERRGDVSDRSARVAMRLEPPRGPGRESWRHHETSVEEDRQWRSKSSGNAAIRSPVKLAYQSLDIRIGVRSNVESA